MRRVVVFLLLAVCNFSDAEIVEPTVKMIDRSPSIGHRRVNMPHQNVPHADRQVPSRRGPGRAAGSVQTSDETVSFGVNTRGEYGTDRVPMYCSCDVLSVLIEGEEGPRDDFGQVMPRRSYTAPELRDKVPLVTKENMKDNQEISFGVNVRGEEGNEYNPTWCTCHVVQPELTRSLPARGSDQDEDEDEDAEAPNAQHAHRPMMGAANVRRPHGGVHLQLGEGSHKAPAADVTKTPITAVSPQDITVTNLQLEAGSQTQAQIKVGTKTGHHHTLQKHSHRHAWSAGVELPSGTHGLAKHTKHAKAQVETRAVGKMKMPKVAELEREFMYHGHKFSVNGQRVKTHHTHPSAGIAAQILTQLDEGQETAMNFTAKKVAGSRLTPLTNHTSNRTVVHITKKSVEVVVQNSSKSLSASPVPIAAGHTANATADPNEDSEAEDAVTALKNLAVQHPHASAILAQALHTASVQQQNQVNRLKEQLRARDQLIQKLALEKEKAEAAVTAELKMVEKLEELRQRSASPSDSPSASPSASLSPSASPSASPSPSPSPSPSLQPSPSPAAPSPVPVPHHRRHRHHKPRIDQKACYRGCKDKDCASLFDQSLRQYAACVDTCAAKCYGA